MTAFLRIRQPLDPLALSLLSPSALSASLRFDRTSFTAQPEAPADTQDGDGPQSAGASGWAVNDSVFALEIQRTHRSQRQPKGNRPMTGFDHLAACVFKPSPAGVKPARGKQRVGFCCRFQTPAHQPSKIPCCSQDLVKESGARQGGRRGAATAQTGFFPVAAGFSSRIRVARRV